MPRGYLPDDYTKGQKVYDAKIVGRLLKYAKPYVGLMIIAFFLLIASSAIEVYLPTLNQKAIDKHIVHNNILLYFGTSDTLRDRLIDRYGGGMFIAGQDSFIINGNILDKSDLKRAHDLGVVLPVKFLIIDFKNVPVDLRSKVQKIIDSNEGLFLKLRGKAGENLEAAPSKNFFFPSQVSKKAPDYALSYGNKMKLPREELKVLMSGDIRGISKIALKYFILLIFSLVILFFQIYTLNKVAQNTMHDVRVDIVSHLQTLSLKYFDKNPVGRLVTRATNDVNTLSEMFTSVVVNLLKDLIVVVGVGIILCLMNLKLALILFIIMPLLFLVTTFLGNKFRYAYRELRKSLAILNARISEDFAGVRIIQSFIQEINAFIRFDKTNMNYFKSSMRVLLVNAIFRPIISLFRYFGVALILWYGGGQVIQESMSLGMLVIYLAYLEMFFRPIIGISEKYAIMQSAMASSERIFLLLDTEPDIKTKENAYLPDEDQIRGKVEFKNVWFEYEDDNWVLKDVSFVVEPGKTIALVGATGVGKTTITSLISRLYDVQRGQILVDDVDIRNWDVNTLRRTISIVLQDAFLFSTNINENIRLYNELIEDHSVKSASQVVNADEFIDQLPKGFEEPVAEGGATLSAGQRQLISFARALVFRPKILILDEATANIDTHTEKLIQDAISVMLSSRTSIVVAHRLSTIREANLILVMHHGKIVERGTHEELMQEKGYYSKLYKLQFQSNIVA